MILSDTDTERQNDRNQFVLLGHVSESKQLIQSCC